MGERVRRIAGWLRPWWSSLPVLVLVTTAVFAVGLVQKAPCYDTAWDRGDEDGANSVIYSKLCYSDIALLYRERGFAEGQVAYLDTADYLGTGEEVGLEYPVLTGAAMQAVAWGTDWIDSRFDVGDAEARSVLFFDLTAVLLFGAALVALVLTYRSSPRRRSDLAMFALAPSLALTATINWDLLAVALTAGALLAWSRHRPALCGVLLGLGVATKLYPLFLLGVLLVLAVRSDRLRAWLGMLGGAVIAWVTVNLPVFLLAPRAWLDFWQFNEGRASEFGSLWYALGIAQADADLVNAVSLIGFVLACAGVTALALFAPRRPRLAQLAFLVVAAFLLVNKVYSPQYVLWLLPLLVLARPNWRDWAIWQSAEAFYWLAIWLHIAQISGYNDDSGNYDAFYLTAVIARVVATGYLCVVIVRDILVPDLDPIRADGRVDDPLGGPFDRAEEPRWLSAIVGRRTGSRTTW